MERRDVSIVYKTLIVPLKCSKIDYEYMMNCFKLSAQVWNACLEFDKKFREENDGNFIWQSDLQRACKKIVPLHAKGIQHTVHKYLYAREATLKAIKSGRKDEKLTYKTKKYFVVGWEKQALRIEKNCLILQRPLLNNKRQPPIKCKVKNIPNNIVLVELIYKDRPYLTIKYKTDDIYEQINSSNYASIDLGEIHSITSIDTLSNAVIITGRKLREIKQLRNKHFAKLRRKVSKCTKGSKQYKKYMFALRKLKYKSERKINDAIHKTAKLYLDFCLENKISVVYYGDLDSATRGTKQKHRGNSLTRQKLGQWNYGKIMDELKNKLGRHGITLVKVSEAYSSQTCPQCKTRNKVRNREYLCLECGYAQHRDIVGSINILNINANCNIIRYKTRKYLQIA